MSIVRYVPAMLLGKPVPLLLIGLVLQAVCAFVAAVGVWRCHRRIVKKRLDEEPAWGGRRIEDEARAPRGIRVRL